MITVRRLTIDEIPKLMRFINDKFWKRDHILAKNREFFDWQFVDDDQVNVFIGIDEEADKIYGMLGIIPCSHLPKPDVTGCMWLSIKSENPVLGMDILNIALKEMNARYAYSPGLTKKARRIYSLQGGTPIAMDHYYRLGDKDEYRIALIRNKSIPSVIDTGCIIRELTTMDEVRGILSENDLKKSIPVKDYRYIEHRYMDHPVYNYRFLGVFDPDDNGSTVLVIREIEQNAALMCKIVDCLGPAEPLIHAGYALNQRIKDRGYEYMDIYSYGVDTSIYEKMGFVRRGEEHDNIIPNYFHPYVQENVDIYLMKPDISGVRLFRGDGDQDRPG